MRAPDLLLPAAVPLVQPYLMRARVLDEARLVHDPRAEAFQQDLSRSVRALMPRRTQACQAAQFRRQIQARRRTCSSRSAEETCRLLSVAA